MNMDTKDYSKRYETTLVAILFFSWGTVFLDRMSQLYLAPYIAPEFHLTHEQVGMLASILAITWAVSTLFFGALSDRFGRRKILIPSVFAFSLLSWVSGIAHTFHQLLLVRALMGIAEGPCWSIMTALIEEASEKIRRRRRAPPPTQVPRLLHHLALSQRVAVLHRRRRFHLLAIFVQRLRAALHHRSRASETHHRRISPRRHGPGQFHPRLPFTRAFRSLGTQARAPRHGSNVRACPARALDPAAVRLPVASRGDFISHQRGAGHAHSNHGADSHRKCPAAIRRHLHWPGHAGRRSFWRDHRTHSGRRARRETRPRNHAAHVRGRRRPSIPGSAVPERNRQRQTRRRAAATRRRTAPLAKHNHASHRLFRQASRSTLRSHRHHRGQRALLLRRRAQSQPANRPRHVGRRAARRTARRRLFHQRRARSPLHARPHARRGCLGPHQLPQRARRQRRISQLRENFLALLPQQLSRPRPRTSSARPHARSPDLH